MITLSTIINKAHEITNQAFNAELRAEAETIRLEKAIVAKKALRVSQRMEELKKEKDKLAKELSLANELANKIAKDEQDLLNAELLAEKHRLAVRLATKKLKSLGYVAINSLQNLYNNITQSDVDLTASTIEEYEEVKNTTLDKVHKLMDDVEECLTDECSYLIKDAKDIYISYLTKIEQLDIVQYALRNSKTTRYFSDELRTEIYLRDGGVCQLCNTKVTLKNYDCDHIIPYSKGGETTLNNGQCTCSSCNRSKGNK